MKNNIDAIEVVLEEIKKTSELLRKLNSRYADGSGPRLSYNEEKRALLELISTLGTTLVGICNK